VKTRHHPTSRAERGIALIVVMVMLLLTTFVLLTSNRVGWLNEKLVSSESDHERAFAAAEALIRDAELDISGRRFDGTPCPVNPATHFGCRNLNAPYFPEGDDDLDVIKTRVATGFNKTCSQGICLPGTSVELEAAGAWTTQLAAMQAAGATYGQFTGAKPAAAGNALLTAGRAWYWVEVFRYSTSYGAGAASSAPVPVAQHPYVYRITAFVQGAKPGTQVRLRSTFVPFLARDFQ
jgi:type IV pilus assembly protein PilX